MPNELFIRELRDLLEKHNVTIGFNCDDCSDTYGIYHPTIEFSGERGTVIASVDGYTADARDLSQLLEQLSQPEESDPAFDRLPLPKLQELRDRAANAIFGAGGYAASVWRKELERIEAAIGRKA